MPAVDLRRFVVSGAVALVLAAGCAAAVLAAGSGGPGGRIVFAANRSPLVYGEIYRLDSDGRRVDLSKSPAADVAPKVSPDGKRVAFVSARGGRAAVYVVGIDGRRLRRVSPRLFTPAPTPGALQAEIAWAPDSSHFAAVIGDPDAGRPGIYAGDLRGGWRLVGRDADPGHPAVAWSGSGRRFAYTTSAGSIQVADRSGRRLWNVPGEGASGWSAHDVLAASANSFTIGLYDASGKAVKTLPGQELSWSPDGRVLASLNGKKLELRRDGTALIATAHVARALPQNGPVSGIQWIGTTRLRIDTDSGWRGYDLAHHRWFAVPAAGSYGSVVSPGGAVAAPLFEPGAVELTWLQVGSSSQKVVARTPSCGDDLVFSELQFVPRRHALVYQSGCFNASADIYAVDPGGSGLRQVTRAPTDETQPSLSPDGQSIVYVQQAFAESCKGCARTLWRVAAVGGAPQQLTSHSDQDAAPFDDSPSWSPDGKAVVFGNSGVSAPFRLLTIPSSGGAAQDLHVQGGIEMPTWGPKRIAFVDAGVSKIVVKTLDPGTGAVRTVATGGPYEVGGLAWSADGRLAYLYDDARGRALIVTVGSTAKPIDLSALLPPRSRVAGLAWSPDGSRFAFTATDANGVGEIYTVGNDGSGLSQVTRNIGAVDGIGVSGSLSWR